jgi:hypothetical protein
LPQWSQIHLLKRIRNAPEFLLLGLAAAGLVFYVIRGLVVERADDERGRTPRLPMLFIGIYFGAVVFFASALSAISAGVQDRGWEISPWRETGFSWIGWAVVIAVALTALYDFLRDYPVAVLSVSILLAVFGFMTSIVNQADMSGVNSRTDTRLYNQVGLLIVNFDDTPEGIEQRCDVLDGLRAFAPNDSELRKMNLIATYVESAANNIYGAEFCDSDSS